MEVFDRQWCNVFVWTPNGAALYHVPRDTAYWRVCFDVLAEFWWAHVVPAKHALAAGKPDAVELCRCGFTAALQAALGESVYCAEDPACRAQLSFAARCCSGCAVLLLHAFCFAVNFAVLILLLSEWVLSPVQARGAA